MSIASDVAAPPWIAEALPPRRGHISQSRGVLGRFRYGFKRRGGPHRQHQQHQRLLGLGRATHTAYRLFGREIRGRCSITPVSAAAAAWLPTAATNGSARSTHKIDEMVRQSPGLLSSDPLGERDDKAAEPERVAEPDQVAEGLGRAANGAAAQNPDYRRLDDLAACARPAISLPRHAFAPTSVVILLSPRRLRWGNLSRTRAQDADKLRRHRDRPL